jgi:hypothetical protein
MPKRIAVAGSPVAGGQVPQGRSVPDLLARREEGERQGADHEGPTTT